MYKNVSDISVVSEYVGTNKLIALDIETSPLEQYRAEDKAALDAHKAVITGISLSVSEGTGIYIPLRHKIGVNADPAKTLEWLRQNVLQNPTVTLVCHNLAFESAFFYSLGVVITCKVYDTIAAAQLTLKGNTDFRSLGDSGLKTLVPQLLGDELPSFSEVTGGRHFDELEPSDTEVVRYACADADYTLRLYHLFNSWFDKWLPKYRDIVEQIESPTAVYCGLMKLNGLLVDAELMERKRLEAEEKLAKLREDISFIIGDVNIGANASTSAFKKYLYQDLGLPVLKTTARFQEAADEEAFVLLKEWCQETKPELERLFDLVLRYRAIGKLNSTYIAGYIKHINSATGRIHPQLLPLGAESGRFSCRNPNIQNQKSGNSDGVTVRDFIIASEGKSLIELDYSQIEARLAAFLSRDEGLLNIYRNGGDLHAMTTSTVYSIPQEEAADKRNPEYKHRRTVAKTTFFGFLYGIYAKSLQRSLKLDAGINANMIECKEFLGNLAASHPTLTAWQKDTIKKAKSRMYAETVLGWRRYLPNIRSGDFMKQGNAERAALNHGVQGLAADLLKLAMGRLLRVMPPYLRPLFTVHDSLVFECPDDRIFEAAAMIQAAMETVPPIPGFDVPIVAEISIGKSYGKMEEMPTLADAAVGVI